MSGRNVLLLFLLAFLFPITIEAQDKKASFYIDADYFKGHNKPHRPEIENLTYKCSGFDIRAGWQSNGNRLWQKAYRNPSYGVGLNYNHFETSIIGSPISLYFFSSFPMLRYKPFQFNITYNLGFSHGINPYDEVTNPDNKATGTRNNVFFGIYADEEISIIPNLSIIAMQGFTHYSNGTLGYPNLGLNAPMLKFGVRYYTRPEETYKREKVKVDEKPWGGSFTLVTGAKKLRPEQSWYYYKEIGILPVLTKRLSYKNRVGIGGEFLLNQAVRGKYIDQELSTSQIITIAVNAQHEFLINRFSVLTQMGIYLHNQPSSTFYYERLGVSYAFLPYLRAGLGLKAHYVKAEYIELSLSFDL